VSYACCTVCYTHSLADSPGFGQRRRRVCFYISTILKHTISGWQSTTRRLLSRQIHTIMRFNMASTVETRTQLHRAPGRVYS
jgi:hypothetical protein